MSVSEEGSGRPRRYPSVVSGAALGVGLALVLAPSSGRSELITKGEGKEKVLVADQFPPKQRQRFALFAKKCTQCHEMARPIAALNTGITPVTGGVFNRDEVKKYVVKMMRKPNSGITRDDAREILLFLLYALEQARSDSDASGSANAEPGKASATGASEDASASGESEGASASGASEEAPASGAASDAARDAAAEATGETERDRQQQGANSAGGDSKNAPAGAEGAGDAKP